MIHPARYRSLPELLEDALHQYPSEYAVIEADRDRENHRWTYAELRTHSLRVSAWLEARALTDGARVVILADNQAAWLASAIGALRVGAVLVPLDRRLTAPEQRALIDHSRAAAIFADAYILSALGPLDLPAIVFGEHPAADSFADLPAPTGPIPTREAERHDVAAIVYSSGTGGAPKGCQLTHGNYLAQYQSLMETFDWRQGDRYFSILPTNHAIDFLCGFIAALCTGSTVVHQRTLRPEHIVSTMRRYQITQMSVVPLILKALEERIREKLDALPSLQRRAIDALLDANEALTARGPNHSVSRWLLKPIHDALGGRLRTIFCGGAFTDRKRAEFFHRLGLPVAIGYGLTEATTVITVNDLRPFRGDTVGAAVPGVEVRVVRPGPDGVGEVQARGPTIFSGYLDDPDQTADAFEDGWLRTGDLGWLDGAHHLHLVGRSKNLVVTAGGKNVYPEDIEAAFGAVPCEELSVFAEDYIWPRRGMEDERLIVVLRPKPDQPWKTALKAANRALADFKRVSAVLIWTEEFPRTASMKIKRGPLALTLRERTAQRDLEAL